MIELFDRSKLEVLSLSDRINDIDFTGELRFGPVQLENEKFSDVAKKLYLARQNGSSSMLMMGAHVIRSGVQKYIIDLMERGYISCVSLNGGGSIHDFEFAFQGASTENVAKYIKDGKFGLWKETGKINDIVFNAWKNGQGLGEALGKYINDNNFTYRDISILAAGARLNIPVTVHVGIGYDILHEHPNCDGAAYGATSYTDFLIYTKILEKISGGIVMNFGSAVMAPEIFLKAIAMVRNVAGKEGRKAESFSTLVCDLVDLPKNYKEQPSKDNLLYYFRPWKTMLVRTVGDGESYYIRGMHDKTIPQLWTAVDNQEKSK